MSLSGANESLPTVFFCNFEIGIHFIVVDRDPVMLFCVKKEKRLCVTLVFDKYD